MLWRLAEGPPFGDWSGACRRAARVMAEARAERSPHNMLVMKLGIGRTKDSI